MITIVAMVDGTLNDGDIPSNVSNNELLDNNAVITANLDGSYTLSRIYILSDLTDNTIPGNIGSVEVTVRGDHPFDLRFRYM